LVRGVTGGVVALAFAALASAAIVAAWSPPSVAQMTPGVGFGAPESTPAAHGGDAVSLSAEIASLRESIALLESRIDELSGGRTPPPWSVALKTELDARIERLMEMQERLAARIETPLPRLDEPIILFTVAASTLVLGFVVGRGLQRRRDRRDGRFRL
jgi:hypothetical protein